MSYAPARARSRAPWIAILLVPLLALASVLVPTASATAAPGDVTGATLQWGVKQSFRSYVTGAFAHGQVVASGVDTATPYGWSGGSGSASDGLGTVAYPGTLQFQAHPGTGVPEGEYALDVTVSDVRVRVTSATTAELQADVVSRNMSTTAFDTYADVVLATLDLSAGTNASTAATVAFTGVPAVLTEAGAPAFAGFYTAGTALDPVSFSWPVEQAPIVPTLAVSQTTGLDPAGATITITGTDYATGFANGHGAGKAGVYLQIGWLDSAWRPSEGAPSASRSNAYQRWVKENPTQGLYLQWTEKDGDRADFSWTVDITKAALDAKAREGATLAVFTVGAGGAVQAANELAVPIAFYDTTTTLAVSKTAGLDPTGETITITGTNYDASALALHGPGAGTTPAGVYAQIGWLDETWRPSAGADSANRSNAYSVWVQSINTTAPYVQWTINDYGLADFTWTVDITKAALDAKAREGASLAVFTVGAGGVTQPANEHAVPIAFYDTTTTLAVSKTTGLDPAGETITVTGTNYDPDYLTGRGTVPGFYAQIGWIDETWRPSAGAASSARSNAYSAWVQDTNDTLPYVKWTINAYGLADFTWTVDITKADLDAKSRDDATLAVFTVGASGVTQAPNEHAVPIAFAVPSTGGGDGGEVTNPILTAGSLSWGVKASFRSYVTGPIAHGSISTTGASAVLGSFVFPQASNANLANGTGSVAYSGSVRFTGHDGVLDLRLSDPQVRIDSATSGTLLLRVGGGAPVAFATLALGSGTKTTDATGAVRYANVPATLTATGSGAFSFSGSTFYPAGTALDPVTFVVGSVNRTSGGTTVVASAATPAANTPDATPPATEGISVPGGVIVEGGQITAEASGYQPNESGILVVLYSEPTVLGEATADAEGRVSWTGALPLGLTGRHTLTFQGSVDRGIVLDIAAARTLECTVADATLTWGVKQSFREYIAGPIANGEWTVAGDVAFDDPAFVWSAGTGGVDADGAAVDLAFDGAVRFTGHAGVLDTTLANPRVVIDGSGATLFVDVNGTTQQGEAVEQAGVAFAELDLDAVTAVRDGDVTTWSEIPATLTAAGASAFGTYPEGEAVDPVTITATTDADCGAEAAAPVAAEVEPLATETASDAGWPLWATILIVVLALLLVIGVIATVVIRRRAA